MKKMKLQVVLAQVARLNMIKTKGFSLAEVIIAAFLLSTIMGGMVNLFLSGKRLGRHSTCRFQAGNVGRYLLDRLQMHVRQDTWDQPGNLLNVGSVPGESVELDRIFYESTYTISAAPLPTLRKVILAVEWVEPAPWTIY